MKGIFFEEVFSIIFLSSLAASVAVRQYGDCNADLSDPTFTCVDGTVIGRSSYCDGTRDCPDSSDERYCGRDFFRYNSQCPTSPRRYLKCYESYKCIPAEWMCDGVIDCPSNDDELNCGKKESSSIGSLKSKREFAIEWFSSQKVEESATRKWGPFVHRTAVALYLSDSTFIQDSHVRKEITYELTIQLLSKLSQKRIQDISSSDLASFINAFLVTCTDPRDFHGFNLVEELRARVEKRNNTNPYVLLALCNAGDIITAADVKQLSDIFWNNNRELWTDTQAVALMALSCARNQEDSSVDDEMIKELALDLKSHQYRNGTVENLLSTILVMQALYSAETEEDPDNFDEEKALSYILQNQKSDGSFGNFFLTYYALPVLNCKSLVDISNSHCIAVPTDENTGMFDLMNRPGPKVHIHYSIWIGKDRDIEKTLVMRVPTNTSFYGIMEMAAEIDSRYKFEYVVKNRKPYIYAVSDIMDDTEKGQFWFPYTVKEKKASLLKESTADMIPQADDHIVMWYREGGWTE